MLHPVGATQTVTVVEVKLDCRQP